MSALFDEQKITVLNIESPILGQLRQIPDPPPQLYVLGNPELLGAVSIAIVGTRRPSAYGTRAAMIFSQELARSGFCIISGLAYGIDTQAHEGALRAEGQTVAVLGHGLDRIYPQANRNLAERILESGGCLVSEYPTGVGISRHHFPKRNRLISGLSTGTVVIEAAARSGSLITAQVALDQGRDVFVVPGAFDDPGFAGSHSLIQQGAKLVTEPVDVLSELPSTFVSRASLSRDDVGGALGDAGSASLRRLFQACGWYASLEELATHSEKTLENLLSDLAQAKDLKQIVEIYPQGFVWVQSGLAK